MSSQPQISSPATSLEPLSDPLQWEIGQQVAFIYNKEEVCLATIKKINYDNTCDLEVLLPIPVTKINWTRTNQDFKRETTVELVPRMFLKVRYEDPTQQFVRIPVALAEAQVGDGIKQTMTDRWQPLPNKLRVPKMEEFHTCLVGTFFNPDLYIYQVRCWRAPYTVREEVFPEVTRIFPNSNKADHFSFKKAFNRYFKEYHQARGKWNRVNIIAINPLDIKQPIQAKEKEEDA